MDKEKGFRTFLILSLICGILAFHASISDYVIWSYVLLFSQISCLIILLYFSDIVKLKKNEIG